MPNSLSLKYPRGLWITPCGIWYKNHESRKIFSFFKIFIFWVGVKSNGKNRWFQNGWKWRGSFSIKEAWLWEEYPFFKIYILMPRYAPYCLTYSFCQLFGSVSKEHLYPSINYCFFVSYNNIQSSICNSAIWKPMPVPVMFFYRNCIFLVISWDPQERNVYKKTLHFLASTWA